MDAARPPGGAGRVAVIGEPLRIRGYGLAGAILCPAADRSQALGAWQALPADVAVVVLTPDAATWLHAELAASPGVLAVVLPEPATGMPGQAVPR